MNFKKLLFPSTQLMRAAVKRCTLVNIEIHSVFRRARWRQMSGGGLKTRSGWTGPPSCDHVTPVAGRTLAGAVRSRNPLIRARAAPASSRKVCREGLHDIGGSSGVYSSLVASWVPIFIKKKGVNSVSAPSSFCLLAWTNEFHSYSTRHPKHSLLFEQSSVQLKWKTIPSATLPPSSRWIIQQSRRLRHRHGLMARPLPCNQAIRTSL